jgi:hypothetical protein
MDLWMDIRHPQWFWAFEKNDRPMRALRECRGLPEQPSIYEGGREVSIRLPFDVPAKISRSDETLRNLAIRHAQGKVEQE